IGLRLKKWPDETSPDFNRITDIYAATSQTTVNYMKGVFSMLNRITLTGRLCADPELRKTQAGISVCSFRIACDRAFGKGEERETDCLDIVAWRGTAEFVCKYFTKGRLITVDGRLQTRPWTDREGNKRTAYEIVTDNVYFGDSKPKGDGEEAGEDDYGQYQSNGYGGYTGPDAGAVPGGLA